MIQTTNIYAFSDKGIRENNEDFIASANDNYFIVCDGMGGHGHGEIASQTVTESLCAFFQALPVSAEKGNLQAALDYAIERLNEQDIYGDAERKMGTTVVLAALTESAVLVGHVGDSRLYHIRPNEGLLFRTKDHSQVQEWVDAEIITEEEARTHSKKNIITRCIQPHLTKQIVMEIDELKNIRTGDYLFLCTDGVTDAMTDEEIVAALSPDISDEDKVNQIKETCASHSKDNYSGFLLKIEEEIIPIIVQNEEKVEVKEKTGYCQDRNKELSEEWKFCPVCGTPIKVKQDIRLDKNISKEQNPEEKPEKKSIKERIKNPIDILCRIFTIAFFISVIVWFRTCGKDEPKDRNVPVYQDPITIDAGKNAKPGEEPEDSIRINKD